MRRALLVVVLAIMTVAGTVARAPSLAAQAAVPVQIGQLSLSTVAVEPLWRAAKMDQRYLRWFDH